jgi:anti-sigma B factor antagonist
VAVSRASPGETTVTAPVTSSPGTEDDPALSVSIDFATATVVLSGELDRDGAHHLVDALGNLLTTGHPRWTVDSADVTWCDVGGLRALAAAHALAVAHGRELYLHRSSRCVDRLVALSGLDQLVSGAPGHGRRPARSARPDGAVALVETHVGGPA